MTEEVEFDVDLLYLENILLSLDMFKFDKDIIEHLNNLRALVDKKLYSAFKYPEKDIREVKYKMTYYYED